MYPAKKTSRMLICLLQRNYRYYYALRTSDCFWRYVLYKDNVKMRPLLWASSNIITTHERRSLEQRQTQKEDHGKTHCWPRTEFSEFNSAITLVLFFSFQSMK